MRKIFLLSCCIISLNLFAQNKIEATSEFIITGKVKAEKRVTLADLENYPTVELSDVNTSSSPRKEEKARSVKLVLVKQILDSVAFLYERPRQLNQYYFLFVAADGYKMVFSFNEIYNTEIGKNLFIITEQDGKKMEDADNRIMVLATKDIKGGSRNMKWLSKIIVCSAE